MAVNTEQEIRRLQQACRDKDDELTALREVLADQFEWAWETWMGWLDQPAYDFDGADKSIQHFDSWH